MNRNDKNNNLKLPTATYTLLDGKWFEVPQDYLRKDYINYPAYKPNIPIVKSMGGSMTSRRIKARLAELEKK